MNFFSKSTIILLSVTIGTTAIAANLSDPFQEFRDPKNPTCQKLDPLIKQTRTLKSTLLKDLESGKMTWRETAEELYPLAIKKSPRSEIFERCGTEGYELSESLAELLEKTPAEIKEEKPLLLEKLNDWKSCLNEMTKSQITVETKSVLSCYEKVIEQL
jgi:hypothetical protein